MHFGRHSLNDPKIYVQIDGLIRWVAAKAHSKYPAINKEDLIQEAWAAVLANIDRYDSTLSKPSTWTVVTAAGRISNYLKSELGRKRDLTSNDLITDDAVEYKAAPIADVTVQDLLCRILSPKAYQLSQILIAGHPRRFSREYALRELGVSGKVLSCLQGELRFAVSFLRGQGHV